MLSILKVAAALRCQFVGIGFGDCNVTVIRGFGLCWPRVKVGFQEKTMQNRTLKKQKILPAIIALSVSNTSLLPGSVLLGRAFR